MRRYLPFFLLLALTAFTARAQSVRWEPADSGDPSDLQLVFENCEPDGDPRLPAVPGATFTLTGSASQTSIINFSATRSTILTYRIRSQRGGAIQIPAFTVQTDKGAQRVPVYTGGAAAAPLDSVTSSTFTAPAASFWAGEVFPLTYTISISRRYYNQIAPTVDWSSTPLIAEDWAKPEPFQTTTNGDQRVGYVYRTRGYAKSPGKLSLNPAQQLVNLQTGSVGFGLFQQPRLEQVTVTSNRPDFTIRPLPANAPAGFNGGVGQYTLVSKVVPTTAAVGEPVTWTLTLAGTGNWPDIPGLPARDVSKDFQVVQPQARRTPAEGKLFDATLSEDVVLVPTRPGTYTLGPVTFAYFDPKTSAYQTITTEKTTVTITAPVAVKSATPEPETATAPDAANTKATPMAAKTPPPPGVIPRDALPGSGHAVSPLGVTPWTLAVVAPFAVVLFTWLGLAMRRARVTDRNLVQRQARERVQRTLAALRQAPDASSRARLLVDWQHDSTVLWQLSHAAPPAKLFRDDTWSALWAESDRALYSGDAQLPEGWIDRAEAAVQAKHVAKFSPFQLFHPRNLLPFLLLCVALGYPSDVRADPAADYRSGKFGDAEKAWRATIKSNPTDWVARHNLALALAQQDRWGEAEAHMTAAFLQHPADSSVQWHLSAIADKAGYVPETINAFMNPGPAQSVARLTSPANWQYALVLASVLVAAALTTRIVGAYRSISRAWKVIATVAFLVGVVGAVASWIGFRAYGNTADPRAAIAWRGATLWSIPTEADTSQKTTALPAGSVAVVDHTFLGWNHLVFSNGQTGWVKKEDVIGLWR